MVTNIGGQKVKKSVCRLSSVVCHLDFTYFLRILFCVSSRSRSRYSCATVLFLPSAFVRKWIFVLFLILNFTFLQNLNFKWYNLNEVLLLNDNKERPTGIVCHKCTNGNCILSVKINKKHTRFCNANIIAIK